LLPIEGLGLEQLAAFTWTAAGDKRLVISPIQPMVVGFFFAPKIVTLGLKKP
jgi:hypothetical protein